MPLNPTHWSFKAYCKINKKSMHKSVAVPNFLTSWSDTFHSCISTEDQDGTQNFSRRGEEVDVACHLRRSHQSVSGCSLRKLCEACLGETLAAFLCERQLLLCCTSQHSLGDWCEPVLCPALALWFLFWLQRESNQSAVKTWPMVKHRKASFVSLQINHWGLTFSGLSLDLCSYILADSCHKY